DFLVVLLKWLVARDLRLEDIQLIKVLRVLLPEGRFLLFGARNRDQCVFVERSELFPKGVKQDAIAHVLPTGVRPEQVVEEMDLPNVPNEKVRPCDLYQAVLILPMGVEVRQPNGEPVAEGTDAGKGRVETSIFRVRRVPDLSDGLLFVADVYRNSTSLKVARVRWD